MSRSTKVIGFSVPPALVKEVERVSREERRTKSELFREMFRVYQQYRKQRDQEELRWGKEDYRGGKTRATAAPQHHRARSRGAPTSGARRAKTLGIKSDEDIVRLIHEHRARRDA